LEITVTNPPYSEAYPNDPAGQAPRSSSYGAGPEPTETTPYGGSYVDPQPGALNDPYAPAATSTAGYPTSGQESTGSSSKTDVVKEEAASVKDTAVDAGKQVAGVASSEASKVASEAGTQVKSLLTQVRSEVTGQAGTQQQRIAGSIHSLAKELGEMASKSDQSGPLADLAHQASRKGGEIAHWLENREPSDLIVELKDFARRRPGTFLISSLVAGIVVGRLTRGAVAANTSIDSGSAPQRALEGSTGPSFAAPATSTVGAPLAATYDIPAGGPTTVESTTYGTEGVLPEEVPYTQPGGGFTR
jgi:gas vesicle protein